MKSYNVSADTILIIITGLLIVIGILGYNMVKDVQDIQTRITIMEEQNG